MAAPPDLKNYAITTSAGRGAADEDEADEEEPASEEPAAGRGKSRAGDCAGGQW